MTRERKAYLDYLTQALAKENFDGVKTRLIATQFLIKASKGNPQDSFREVMDSFGNEDTEKAILSIESELEKKTLAHPPIERDSVKRIAKHHSKLVANLQKLSIEIGGVDMSEKIRREATPSIPEIFLPKHEPKFTKYSATATTKAGKAVKLEVEYSV